MHSFRALPAYVGDEPQRRHPHHYFNTCIVLTVGQLSGDQSSVLGLTRCGRTQVAAGSTLSPTTLSEEASPVLFNRFYSTRMLNKSTSVFLKLFRCRSPSSLYYKIVFICKKMFLLKTKIVLFYRMYNLIHNSFSHMTKTQSLTQL